MPTVPMNDLRRSYEADAEALRRAVVDVLDGGWYVHGPQHEMFEREFADFNGVSTCVGVASGTDALELALTALAVPGRSTVITASNAGGYTSVAARRTGMRLRYADVRPDTLCIDADDVQRLLEEGDAAVVVATHLYGRMADVDRLVDVCANAGVPLLEDCAQAVGASRAGRRAGSFGNASTFSFYPTKNLGAFGDGGAVLTSDSYVAHRLRALRQYGWSQKYVISLPNGRNSRLDEVQAALLRVRLTHLDGWNARRRVIIARYVAAGARTVHVLPTEGEDHAGHLAVALCDDRAAAQRAFEGGGVRTDVHYPVPDHLQTGLAGQHDERALPVTEAAAGRVLSLPCFPELTEDEIRKVCDVLAGI